VRSPLHQEPFSFTLIWNPTITIRIRIEDLSPMESISAQEMAEVSGAGRRKKSQHSGHAADVLELRQMVSVNSVWLSGKTLVVKANDIATKVEVHSSGSSIEIKDTVAGKTWKYSSSQVGKVDFQGSSGNDRFVNHVKDLPVRGFGNGGNDYLEGYDGADYFSGGS
jgi:hypothetical protein